MHPSSKWIPKEMMTFWNKPALLWVLEEISEMELEQVIVVSHPAKKTVERFLQETDVLKRGNSRPTLEMVYQTNPLGLADALREGWSERNQEGPAMVLLPDNLFFGHESGPDQSLSQTSEMLPGPFLKEHYEGEDHLTLLHPVKPSEFDDYGYQGSPEIKHLDGKKYELKGIPDKNREKDPEQTSEKNVRKDEGLRSCGRLVVSSVFFEVLEEIEEELRSTGKELDDVPVVQTMIEREYQVHGIKFPERIYDVGHPPGAGSAWKRLRDMKTVTE